MEVERTSRYLAVRTRTRGWGLPSPLSPALAERPLPSGSAEAVSPNLPRGSPEPPVLAAALLSLPPCCRPGGACSRAERMGCMSAPASGKASGPSGKCGCGRGGANVSSGLRIQIYRGDEGPCLTSATLDGRRHQILVRMRRHRISHCGEAIGLAQRLASILSLTFPPGTDPSWGPRD